MTDKKRDPGRYIDSRAQGMYVCMHVVCIFFFYQITRSKLILRTTMFAKSRWLSSFLFNNNGCVAGLYVCIYQWQSDLKIKNKKIPRPFIGKKFLVVGGRTRGGTIENGWDGSIWWCVCCWLLSAGYLIPHTPPSIIIIIFRAGEFSCVGDGGTR